MDVVKLGGSTWNRSRWAQGMLNTAVTERLRGLWDTVSARFGRDTADEDALLLLAGPA